MAVAEQLISLPYHFIPWPHQEEVFTDFYDRGIRRFLDCWHRRCLARGTHVTMADGSWKPIETLIPGDHILTWHDGSYKADTVRDVWMAGRKPCIQVQAPGFPPVTCTPDHPFLVRHGEHGYRRRFLPIGEIQPKGPFGSVDTVTLYAGYASGQRADGALAALCGYLVSDGSVHPTQSPKFTNCEMALLKRVAALAFDVFGIEAQWRPKGLGYDLGLPNGTRGGGKTPNPVKAFFQQQGALGVHATRRIPRFLWECDAASVWAFLGAVLDADGSLYLFPEKYWNGKCIRAHAEIKIHAGESEGLAWDYYWLLRKWGVRVGSVKVERETCWTLRIWAMEAVQRVLAHVQLVHPQKARLAETLLDMPQAKPRLVDDGAYAGVVGIHDAGVQETWDIETVRYQRFLANGYVVHNSGKDKTWINLIVDQMMQRVGNYCHVLPQRTRARLVIWEAIDAETGMRLIDHFPEALIHRRVENEMYISLIHPDDPSREGSIYRAMGSDKDEHLLVGSNPIGIVWSEYPEINPRLRTLALPILRRNKGWEALCYTPRGGRQNHGCRLFFQVQHDPEWHVRYLTTTDTVDHEGNPLVTQADIDADIKAGMSLEEAEQEYGLSWDSPMPGAYYAAELRQAEKDGRICRVDYDPALPTYTAWDLGTNDVNAIWYFQPAGREVRFLEYEESSSVALVPDLQHPEHDSWIQRVRRKPYCYDHSQLTPPLSREKHEVHYGPHDLEVHEYSTNKTRYGHALEHGLRFTVLPHPGPGGLADGIETARRLLGRSVFDSVRCQQGLDALRSYRRQKDEKTHTFSNQPLHDWASNGSSAFRYAAVGLMPPQGAVPPSVPANSFQFHRQNVQRLKLGLAPRSWKVSS